MTRLFNDPAAFADEMVEGFAAAAAEWVQPVPGGVVRSTRAAEPSVAVVIGGGSGHYPAFGGLVGAGLAHGAAMGNLFASPSSQQVHSVAKAADQGEGVLLSYGNYAGDVLNFDEAQARLIADGHDVRTVVVTDDIWSAPTDRTDQRRGIAGGLAVYKIAGAAAEAGYDLDGVERVARLANERTRSFGVAFSGCTLPGAPAPLFQVPPGRMAVGLGIHGEPGIDEVDVPTADELAALFVERLLDEAPGGLDPAGARVVPLLNGLGGVKYEELFVVYRAVHRLLAERGVTVVEPEVGELCTSFDMAGCSLTLLWLDEELERLWAAPADAPAYRKGSIPTRARAEVNVQTEGHDAIAPGSAESQRAAARVGSALDAMVHAIDAAADELGRLDQVAGDGDHGIGMQRGVHAGRDAARTAIAAGAGTGTTLNACADAWSARAGGTSGAIWAAMLRARDAVMAFGKARVGDKTMVDAIVPFADALTAGVSNGDTLADAWSRAALAAQTAADRTTDMAASLGRARSHGDRSIGTPDPGAISFALLTRTVHTVLADPQEKP